MHAIADIEQKDFEPITLTVEFETKNEVEKFYALINHAGIVDSLNLNSELLKIRGALKRLEPDLDKDTLKYHNIINYYIEDPK